MRLVAFEHDGRFGVGAVAGDAVRPFDLAELGPEARMLGAAAVVWAQAKGRSPTPGDDAVPLEALR
ncbi:MAG: hypothetical protein AAF684_11215, partial [Pseudomonadota bacterium]